MGVRQCVRVPSRREHGGRRGRERAGRQVDESCDGGDLNKRWGVEEAKESRGMKATEFNDTRKTENRDVVKKCDREWSFRRGKREGIGVSDSWEHRRDEKGPVEILREWGGGGAKEPKQDSGRNRGGWGGGDSLAERIELAQSCHQRGGQVCKKEGEEHPKPQPTSR